MSVRAFTGGAGFGKTFQLMQALERWLEERQLEVGQKVLALTFMHGSRRRLEEKLRSVPLLSGKFDCATVDSFAWRIVRRWRSLCADLGFRDVESGDYLRIIDAAVAALEVDHVSRWVACTFPILLLDEAQDLTAARLRVVAVLSSQMDVLAAADEFQCLDEALRPNPGCAWLDANGDCVELTHPMRTNQRELVGAANAVRAGQVPRSGDVFKVQSAFNAGMAGSWLSNQIHWYGGGRTVAVITPVARQFSRSVLDWVGAHTTRQNSGPYSIRWEQSDVESANEFLERIAIEPDADIDQVLDAIDACGDPRVYTDVENWLQRQRRTLGRSRWRPCEIEAVVRQSFYLRRRQGSPGAHRLAAMTVHGAKNREFDVVVVLWPAATVGSPDQKRRLLYNAITRAKMRCLVLVQSQASLRAAPFA